MTFCDRLHNFNINFLQPRFGFNFGCCCLPNIFPSIPFLRPFGHSNFNPFLQPQGQINYFSPTPTSQPFNQINFISPTLPPVQSYSQNCLPPIIPSVQPYGSSVSFNFPSIFNFGTKPIAPSINFTGQTYNYEVNNSWFKDNSPLGIDSFIPSSIYSISKDPETPSSITYTYDSSSDKYATDNAEYLRNLDPVMREKTEQLIAYAITEGYDIKINSGRRTEEEQQALIEKDERNGTNFAAKKGSPHLSGIAIDISVFKDGNMLSENSPDIVAFAKNTLGMRWGGDFVNWANEPWHFDIKKA